MTMSLTRCQSTSSSAIVINDEDLLTLILLHVPYRKLNSLKCVSKTWLYVITTPLFTRSLCNLIPHLRASALFIQQPPVSLYFKGPFPDEVYFVPLDDPKTPSPYKTLTFAHDPFDPQRVRILGSCNGLLLCSTCLFAAHKNTYVYNPSTNQLTTLPQYSPLTPPNTYVHLNLAFDPSKSPHFKVLAFVKKSQSDSFGDFHLYSSQTGTWSMSIQSFFGGWNIKLRGGVYWHGCIHWLGYFNSTAFHGLYFNVDEATLRRFPGPPIQAMLSSRSSDYFGESEHHLHFIEVGPDVTLLSVYEMKSDYSKWFIKYRIDLTAISKVFPEMTQSKTQLYRGNSCAVDVLSLIRRENFQEDSFLVLEIPGKAIRYNLVNRSFKVIWNFAVDFGLEDFNLWQCGSFRVSQYIGPLSCV